VSLLQRIVAGLLLSAAASIAVAQDQGLTGTFDTDFNQRPWAEFASHLPKFPDAADLAEIHVEGEQDTRFYVDLASIDLGPDAIIRYTLLTRSASGAESLTYEGLRCFSAERKLYAFGRKDRSWDKALSSRWIPIVLNASVNSYHAALYLKYFCKLHAPLASREILVDTIKKGGLPPEKNY
jgi:CNP1-like family protein